MAVFIGSALVISSGGKGAMYFDEVLSIAGFEKIVTVKTAGEARRLLVDSDFDICIINSPLMDENGERLAQSIASNGVSGVILCVKAEYFDEVCANVEDFGVITVSKPINRGLFWNAVKMTLSIHRKLQRIQNENRKLVQKIEDIRVVDRAKCTLISYLAMNESEAHRYIEKQAMDMRISKREVAERILKTYES